MTEKTDAVRDDKLLDYENPLYEIPDMSLPFDILEIDIPEPEIKTFSKSATVEHIKGLKVTKIQADYEVREPWPGHPFGTTRRLTPDEKSCNGIRGKWVFSGYSKTGVFGRAAIHLSDFLNCQLSDDAPPDPDYQEYLLMFTAIPMTDKPVLLTFIYERNTVKGHEHYLVPAYDISITVCSWSLQGNPVPDLWFSWQAWSKEIFPINDL